MCRYATLSAQDFVVVAVCVATVLQRAGVVGAAAARWGEPIDLTAPGSVYASGTRGHDPDTPNSAPLPFYWGSELMNGASCQSCVGQQSGGAFCRLSDRGTCYSVQSACRAACATPCAVTADQCANSLNTNKWWGDLVLEQSIADLGATLPVMTLPYFLRAPASGLFFTMPGLQVLQSKQSAFESNSFISVFEATCGFSVMDPSPLLRRVVSDFDELSAEVAWLDSATVGATGSGSSGSAVMSTRLVRGDPFVSVTYVKPSHVALHSIFPLSSVKCLDATASSCSGQSASGAHFLLQLDDSANGQQLWLLTASPTLSFAWSPGFDGLTPSSQTRRIVSTSTSYTGTLRLARVYDASQLSVLLEHSSCMVNSTNVDASVGLAKEATSPVTVTVGLKYLAHSLSTGQACDPLLLSLPHHRKSIKELSNVLTSHIVPSVRGPMMGYTGSTLTTTFVLDRNVSFTSASVGEKIADPAVHNPTLMMEALMKDSTTQPPAKNDIYNLGKETAALSRLALIADELLQYLPTAADKIRQAQATALATLHRSLSEFFAPMTSPMLRYDPAWGGICSANGLASSNNDFGQGWYNDHHFHYGYFLFASAVLARYNATWGAAHRDGIYLLVRDIANPSNDDPYFPVFRMFDWFEGHSYATGLFPFGDVKNQESSSEAINAWYGMKLLGEAMGDEYVMRIGTVLLATEITSVQTYWHVYPTNYPHAELGQGGSGRVYPTAYASGKGIAGIVWNSKVDHATFFGVGEDLIQGIQMLPFTPATSLLLTPCWVLSDMPNVDVALYNRLPSWGPIQPAWRGFMLMAQSIVDRDDAWQKLLDVDGYDDGNSKTNALYWIATRPDFDRSKCPQPLSHTVFSVVWLTCVTALTVVTAVFVEVKKKYLWCFKSEDSEDARSKMDRGSEVAA